MPRIASLSTMELHVDEICVFACMRWYTASGSVFLIKNRFGRHLSRMAEIMCSIPRR